MTESPRLPNEILQLIFQFLSPKELATVNRVSKLWHDVAEDNALWVQLVGTHFPKHRSGNPSAKQLFHDLYRTQRFHEQKWMLATRICRPVYSKAEQRRLPPNYGSATVPTQLFSSTQTGEVRRFAVKFADGLVVYDPDTLQVISERSGPPPGGPMVFVGSQLFIGEGTTIERLVDGSTEPWLDVGSHNVLQLEAVQNNRLLALTEDGRVLLWNVDSKERAGELTGEGDPVEAVSVSHDGRFVALKYSDVRIDLRDLKTGAVQQIGSPGVYRETGYFNGPFGLFSDGNQVQLVQVLDKGICGTRHARYTAWPADEAPVEAEVWEGMSGFVLQSTASFQGLPLMAKRCSMGGCGFWGVELCTTLGGKWTSTRVIPFGRRQMANATLTAGNNGLLFVAAFDGHLELFRPVQEQKSLEPKRFGYSSSSSTNSSNVSGQVLQKRPTREGPQSDAPPSSAIASAMPSSLDAPYRGPAHRRPTSVGADHLSSSSTVEFSSSSSDRVSQTHTTRESSHESESVVSHSSSSSKADVDRPAAKTPFPWLLVSAVALSALLGSAFLLHRSRLI